MLTLVSKKELLPCPFCGSYDIYGPTERDVHAFCKNCHSYGSSPILAGLRHTRECVPKAIDLWNIRIINGEPNE